MDVTGEIIRNNQVYGASDYTGAHTLSASRSLNYAEGLSINKPQVEELHVIPYTFNYQDAVGLFGAENRFVRVDVDVDRDFAQDCFEEPWYECAEINDDKFELNGFYSQAVIDYDADPDTVNTYEPAEIIMASKVPLIYDPYISVSLQNLKVNNMYIDDWLDVCLYDKTKQAVGDDFMYLRLRDHFYVGFHARNTRRLPYNVQVTVGAELRSGLPSTECNDQWEIKPNDCDCIEEEGWVCAEMSLYNEGGTGYTAATVDVLADPNTVNSYQPSRVTLQGTECINEILADYLDLPKRGRVGQVPPPATAQHHTKKAHSREPCCATCH